MIDMHSRIVAQPLPQGEPRTLTIGYPDDANLEAGIVSVLSPVGLALLGVSVGQTAHWKTPDGRSESLRIEAGLPNAGPDLNENVVPPEANLEGKAFSLSKGCYPGQEVVARMDTYGSVRRKLVGLVMEDSAIPPSGAKLFIGEREVGWISSAVRSPSLDKVIAFGFPLRDFTAPGTTMTVEIEGRHLPATVHALPFVKTS